MALSFVPASTGRLVLAGMFDVTGGVPCTLAEMELDPAYRELSRLLAGTGVEDGIDDDVAVGARTDGNWLRFSLTERHEMASLRGRLVIPAPGTRAFVRRFETFDPEIVAITEAPILAAMPPDWRGYLLTGTEVRALPGSWSARLAEWRGIYLIVDEADGARYVGSAYGGENLLGRWRSHVTGEQGVTTELRRRNPSTFRFSILERVSPDMPAEEVIRLEQTWMDRLHTRRFGLNAGVRSLAERTVND